MKPARRPHGLDRDGMMLAPAAFLRYLECSVSAVIQPYESFVLCMFRAGALAAAPEHGHGRRAPAPRRPHYCPSPMPQPYYANAFSIASDRKSVVSGTSVSVRVDLGGPRIIKKKIKKHRKYSNSQ